jgi:hypothetical protein
LIPPGVFFEEIFERSVKIKPATTDPALATRSGAGPPEEAPTAEQEDLTKQIAQVMLIEAV